MQQRVLFLLVTCTSSHVISHFHSTVAFFPAYFMLFCFYHRRKLLINAVLFPDCINCISVSGH